MINFAEIKNVIQSNQLIIFEGEAPDDILSRGFKFSTLDELMRFCKIQSINVCFIETQYTKVQDYKISKELTEEYVDVDSLPLKHQIIDTIKKYNSELDGIDDSNPTEIIVAVLYQSNYFYYYQQEDLLFEGEIILEPEDKIQDILDLFESELDDEREEHQKIIDEQINKLEEFILNDPDFKNCTNQRLRKDYIRKLFKNKLGNGFKELKKFWTSPDIPGYVYRGAEDMIELLWRKIKNK